MSTLMLMARVSGASTLARKPRSRGRNTSSEVIGLPASTNWRTSEPRSPVLASAVSRIAPDGTRLGCAERTAKSSSRAKVPAGSGSRRDKVPRRDGRRSGGVRHLRDRLRQVGVVGDHPQRGGRQHQHHDDRETQSRRHVRTPWLRSSPDPAAGDRGPVRQRRAPHMAPTLDRGRRGAGATIRRALARDGAGDASSDAPCARTPPASAVTVNNCTTPVNGRPIARAISSLTSPPPIAPRW